MPVAYSLKQIELLENVLNDLSIEEFANLRDKVFNSTIGKHTRHIIDFYNAFFLSYDQGEILCYENRRKQEFLETDLELAIGALGEIRLKLLESSKEKSLLLKATINEKCYKTHTNSTRELLFLNDHTTHHIAIIRFILAQFNIDKIENDCLGMAHSTPKQ